MTTKEQLLISWNEDNLIVPLTWAGTTTSVPYANLGDALSPVTVSALSGIRCEIRSFHAHQPRLAAVGTIGHNFKNGVVHFWGTGVDSKRNPVDPSLPRYTRPDNTEFHVHALRGPFSRRTLVEQGIEAPEIYGDPVWFLPAIFPAAAEKIHDLGVIVHISELERMAPSSPTVANFRRYHVPPALAGRIIVIDTLTEATIAGLARKIAEITACRRIVSTSLHGLVIAETYGIPCLYFSTAGRGALLLDLTDDETRVDHRVRDFYGSVGRWQLTAFGQPRPDPSDWEEVIGAVDDFWRPLDWDPRPFLDAFPLPLRFDPTAGRVLENRSVLDRLKL